MANESTWNIETFLDKLRNSLITSNLDKIINLNPDIDSSVAFESWYDTSNYWNESVKNLWNSWIDRVPSDPEDKKRDIGDVINSDAGFDFSKEPYVKPDLNIDSQTYENVRGDDKIESVLKNKKQMQYTHTQNKVDGVDTEKYIRLLMPKYLRRVEVEDLNRNFWVIAQTIGLISEYLLSPDSPLNKLIEGMLKEIAQLWDNIHRIWEALYAIGEKTNNNEQQISQIAEAVQKTKIKIDLNTYPDYSVKAVEFRKMLMIDKIDPFYVQCSTEVILKKLYFFGHKAYHPEIGADLAKIKNNPVNKVLLERLGLPLEINNRNQSLCQSAYAEYIDKLIKTCGINEDTYIGFRIGCIIEYSYNGDIYMVSYDKQHMYEPSTADFFGPYKWCRILGKNGAVLLINDIIKGVYDEDEDKAKEILASDPSKSQSYGPIIVERDGVNKKPLNKILAEISGFNFALLDAFGANSSNIYELVLTKDLIPDRVKYSELLESFLSILCDFETSGMESYKSQKGENVSVIWTIPGVILSQLNGQITQLADIKDINKQYGLSYILKLGESKLDTGELLNIDNLKKYYEDYLSEQTNDNYYKLLNEFLRLLKLLPTDVGMSTITANTSNNWLSSYENAVKNKINDEQSFCYEYFNNISENKKEISYYTPCPWLILEPTLYSTFTKIKCGTANGDNYKNMYNEATGYNNNYKDNIWKLISSILPEDCFQIGGGEKLIPSYEDKDNKVPILKWTNIYGEDSGPLNNLSNSSYKELLLANNYNAQKIPVILGTLSGWDYNGMNFAQGGMASLQPYYNKTLDNYWISFSSASLTGGRVHMKIIHSNYRFFSPFNGIKGVIDDSIGQCYDVSPHNTSITVGYWNPIGEGLKKEFLNSILKFNSPEYSPNGFQTNYNTNNANTNIYNHLGIKKGVSKNTTTDKETPKELTVIRRCSTPDEQTDCIVDGFLGYESYKDFYENTEGLIGENYNNSGIAYDTTDIDKKLDDIEYTLRSPTFWTHTESGGSTGAFRKIREVYAYGAYGLINGKKDSEGNQIRPYDYNEIKMIDLLSDTFFERKTPQQIYTIQVDFQRFSITGSTQSIYAIIYMSKDSQEIYEQKYLADKNTIDTGLIDKIQSLS